MNTDAIGKVEQACTELIANQQPVTFTQVATRTGLGRTTLYRNPSRRALIEEHRHHAARAGTVGAENSAKPVTWHSVSHLDRPA